MLRLSLFAFGTDRPHVILAGVLGFLAAAFVALLTLWVRRRYVRSRLLRRFRRARVAEDKAVQFLDESGYRVIAQQVPIRYSLWVDGRETEVDLKLDYVVERNGQRYVAEVKSGEVAPSLAHAPTRRQLIEYGLATQTTDVLLVDPDRRSIAVVSIPRGARPSTVGGHVAIAIVYFLLGALCSASVAIWRYYG